MSVQLTTTLPNSPAAGTGNLRYVPLGGDGKTAPFGAWSVGQNLSHDASGGTANIVLELDDRYCSVVSFMSFRVSGAAADVEFHLQIASGIDRAVFTGLLHAAPTTLASQNAGGTWIPPGIILCKEESVIAQIGYTVVNTTGDASFLSTYIYLFNNRVRELTPMGIIQGSRFAGQSAVGTV